MGFFSNLATPAPIPTVDHASQWEDIVNAYVSVYADGVYGDALASAAVYRARQMNASTVAALPLTLNGTAVPAPNVHQSWLQFITEVILSMEDHGEAYVYVTAEASMSVLPNRDVIPKWNTDATRRLYERAGSGTFFNDDPASMFRNLVVVPLNRGPGDLTGVGPMESGRVQSVLAAQKFVTEYYANSAQPSGSLMVPSPLTADEASTLQSQWAARTPRAPAVLSGGIDFKNQAFSPQESQWVEGHTAGVLDIASLFGVPPHFLSASPAGSSLTYTNIQDLNRSYWLNCLWPLYAFPILSAVAEVMSVPVEAFEFNTETLFLPGLAERSQAASVLVAAGYDPDDVLGAVGLPMMSTSEVEVASPVQG